MQQTKFMNKTDKRNAREEIETAQAEGIQFFQFEELGVTVVLKRTGHDMIMFAVAIASPEEAKFRKLMGKVKALERFDFGPMPAVCPKGCEAAFAAELAHLVG